MLRWRNNIAAYSGCMASVIRWRRIVAASAHDWGATGHTLTRHQSRVTLRIWRTNLTFSQAFVGRCTSAICSRPLWAILRDGASRINAVTRSAGSSVDPDERLPKNNAVNLTSVTESAVLCNRRARVPTRAPAASVPGDSGWIPVSRKGEATGPAVFLLVHFSSKIGAA